MKYIKLKILIKLIVIWTYGSICFKMPVSPICVVFRSLTAFIDLTAVNCFVDKDLSRLITSNRWWNRTSNRLANDPQCFTLTLTHLTSTLPCIIGLQNQLKLVRFNPF